MKNRKKFYVVLLQTIKNRQRLGLNEPSTNARMVAYHLMQDRSNKPARMEENSRVENRACQITCKKLGIGDTNLEIFNYLMS